MIRQGTETLMRAECTGGTHGDVLRQRCLLTPESKTRTNWSDWPSYVGVLPDVADVGLEHHVGASRPQPGDLGLAIHPTLVPVCPALPAGRLPHAKKLQGPH
ncbi:hypothetical protein LDENG_00291340 [Lucifuga dentata]|nr:hypothetical protein LDENG_00291340 [Lucifuga dentata]